MSVDRSSPPDPSTKAVPVQPRGRAFRPGRLFWVVALSLVGCRQEAVETISWSLLLDPQVAMLDGLAPHTTFDGVSGSIVLGQGWPPRIDDGREAHVWAIGQTARAYFLGPAGKQEVDFVARCGALDVPDVSPQVMTIFVNETQVGVVFVAPGWQEVRVPLPSDLPLTGRNELRLEFAWALRPRDHLPGNEDPRPLAVHFSHLGIVPRTMTDPWGFLASSALRPAEATARLPVGGSVTVPVPPAVGVELDMPAIAWGCESCRLTVESVDESGLALPLATATPDGEQAHRIRLTTEDRPQRLRFRVDGTGGFDVDRHVELAFLKDSLRLRRRPMPEPAAPSFIVYLVDTLRADALQPYGAEVGASPRVAAFAGEAVLYERPWSASSWTLPATYSVLTGLTPHRHGMMDGGLFAPHEGVVPVPVRLAGLGYESFGVSHSYIVGPEYAFDRGFTRFLASDQLNVPFDNGFLVRRAVLQWLLTRDPATPFFLYIHTVDPHPPYTPPDDFFDPSAAAGTRPETWDPLVFMQDDRTRDREAIRQLEERYRAEVRYADREFGAFLDLIRYLRLYDASLVALLSDHGEEFAEHGGLGHGRTVYEELLQVPLVVKFPRGAFAGQRVEEPVSTLDLAPTLLRLASAPRTELAGLDGQPLPPLATRTRRWLTTEVRLEANPLLSPIDYRALLVGYLKCIHTRGPNQFGEPVPEHRAFDLSTDPAEISALLPPAPAGRRCRDLVTGWLRLREEPRGDGRKPSSDEAREKLRALGYIQ